MHKPPDPRERSEMLAWAAAFQMRIDNLERQFRSGSDDSLRALEALRRDWGQISKCLRWCLDHLETDSGAAIMCSKLAGVGGQLLDHHLSRLELIRLREVALRSARKMSLFEDRMAHLTYLAYAHFMNSNSAKALELLDEAIELGRREKNLPGYATALQHRGMFYSTMGREKEAIEALEEALSGFERLHDQHGSSGVIVALAHCHSRLKKPAKAIELYRRALSIEKSRSGTGTILCNMSGELTALEQFQEARACLLRSEKIAKDLSGEPSSRESQGHSLPDVLEGLVEAQFGLWHVAQSDPDLRIKAWAHFESALTIFQKRGDRYHEANVLGILESLYRQVVDGKTTPVTDAQKSQALRRLMQILLAKEEYGEFLDFGVRLVDLAESTQDLPDQLEATISLTYAAVQLHRYEEAIAVGLKAQTIMGKIRERDDPNVNLKAETDLLLTLGNAYRHHNQPADAIQCYERVERICREFEREWREETDYRAKGNRALVLADTGRCDEAIALLTEIAAFYEGRNDLRLFGHAQFNVAYAHFRRGDLEEAKVLGAEALRHLLMINDSHIEDVKRQIDSWDGAASPKPSDLSDPGSEAGETPNR